MVALAAIVALSTVPAAFNPQEPGFWQKSYRIRETQCEIQIAVEFPDVAKAIPLLSDCPPQNKTAKELVLAGCRLPKSTAERLVERLKARGRLLWFNRGCITPELLPELDYKNESLRAESNRVSLSTSAFPGITGLLETQLSALDWYRRRRDQSLMTSLLVNVQRRGTGRFSYQWRPPADAVGPPPELNHPWARVTQPVCWQTEIVDVVLDLKRGGAEARQLAATAGALGSPHSHPEPECVGPEPSAILAVVFSRKPLLEIQSQTTALAGLRDWNHKRPRRVGGSLPDDEKFGILEAELTAARALLADAPVLTAFLEAELARLGSNVARLAELRKGTLVYFRQVSAKN